MNWPKLHLDLSNDAPNIHHAYDALILHLCLVYSLRLILYVFAGLAWRYSLLHLDNVIIISLHIKISTIIHLTLTCTQHYSEITENPFKEDSQQSVSTPNPDLDAAEQEGQQLHATGEDSSINDDIRAMSVMKNTIEVKVDCENGDYRELEASFAMTRNTSYSGIKQ